MFNKKYGYISIVLALTLLSGCGSKPVETAPDIKNVKIVEAKNSSVELTVEYAGKLKAVQEINISSKLAGKVSAANFKLGDTVKAGDTLFTLEKTDVQGQYDQAAAALKVAKSNYNRTSSSVSEQQILQAQTQLDMAQQQYDDTKKIYEDTEGAIKMGRVTQIDLDTVSAKLNAAKKQLDGARDALVLLQTKILPESLDTASAQVDQAQAAVSAANIAVNNTIVNSPISGLVAAKNIDVGMLTASTVPAYTIIDTSTVILEVAVTDKMLLNIKKGDKVPVKVSAYEDNSFQGTVDVISPSVDPRTGLYAVRINISNPDGRLKAGMISRVSLKTEHKENCITVPKDALVVENSVSYVYTVEDGIVKKKVVNVGISDNTSVEITSNLNTGENVITEGQSFLNEGDKVNTVN